MMVLSLKASVALIAVLISSVYCSQDTAEIPSLRDEVLDDYTDIYSRDFDNFEDPKLLVRDSENEGLGSVLPTFSPSGSIMPKAQNTPQDIQSLCSKPIPTAQEFTGFFNRSGFPSDRALFWSGIKDSVAMEIGFKLQRITLEMMVKPNNIPLEGCGDRMNGSDSRLWWNAASGGFGDWATDSVAVVLSEKRHAEIREGKSPSTWIRVELPTLWKKFTAKVRAAFNSAYTGAQNTVTSLAHRLKSLRGQTVPQNPTPPVSSSSPPEDQQQDTNNVFSKIQMYICDADGGNLQSPRAYDGPIPVSGNAPRVRMTI